ncbi:MAG: hypothetical protein R6U10_07725, partial [Thermoplasmatota archaeon]
MHKEIDDIRKLLDDLEKDIEENSTDIRKHFDFLELPEIICNIIDYLQPLLHPYEAAIYWYMLR